MVHIVGAGPGDPELITVKGQRYLQDQTRDKLMSEIDQVRKHQEMLKRLIEGEPAGVAG